MTPWFWGVCSTAEPQLRPKLSVITLGLRSLPEDTRFKNLVQKGSFFAHRLVGKWSQWVQKTFGAKKRFFGDFLWLEFLWINLNSISAGRELKLGLVGRGSWAQWLIGSMARWLGLVGWGLLAGARWLRLAGSGLLARARARWLAPKLRLAVKRTKGLSLSRLIFFWKLGLKQPLNQKVQKVGFTIKLFVCHLGTAGSC